MRFVDKKQKMDYLLELIRKECTGCSEELSNNLCISKRTLHRYIQDLRELGYSISYCHQRTTYYLYIDI